MRDHRRRLGSTVEAGRRNRSRVVSFSVVHRASHQPDPRRRDPPYKRPSFPSPPVVVPLPRDVFSACACEIRRRRRRASESRWTTEYTSTAAGTRCQCSRPSRAAAMMRERQTHTHTLAIVRARRRHSYPRRTPLSRGTPKQKRSSPVLFLVRRARVTRSHSRRRPSRKHVRPSHTNRQPSQYLSLIVHHNERARHNRTDVHTAAAAIVSYVTTAAAIRGFLLFFFYYSDRRRDRMKLAKKEKQKKTDFFVFIAYNTHRHTHTHTVPRTAGNGDVARGKSFRDFI